VSTIPNSLSREDFEAVELGPLKARCVVPYCTVGVRSGRYAMRLRRSGFSDVHNGEGILLWSHVAWGEQALVKPSGSAADSIHVFGPRFDVAHEQYVPVTFSAWDKAQYLAHCWWNKVFETEVPLN
jgi:predicted sulfurtransferase